MFLSRIKLNPRVRRVQRYLADCREMHRTVMSLFPNMNSQNSNARESLNILYRLEVEPSNGRPVLLLQSDIEPNWKALEPGCFEEGETKSIKESIRNIHAGDCLRFRLVANPTRKVDTKSGLDSQRRNGRRVFLTHPREQQNWLDRKGDQHGFQIIKIWTSSESVGSENFIPGTVMARERKNLPGMKFGTVRFDGLLTVADEVTFREALRKGIGSGKAFGFGLLSVAPA